MTESPAPSSRQAAEQALRTAMAEVNRVVLGKPREVALTFTCLLAKGHLLLEDLPGVGKTTLAHAMAAVLGLSFHRMQFTSDLLPSDILGVSIYERESGRFEFRPGPIFSQLLLADEINRASPKTQSALLEAMAEQQVTIDGVSHGLPDPFMVVATQNPVDLAGTFPLPDSQLDRFLMRLSLGYPDAGAERAMLVAEDRAELISRMLPRLALDHIALLRREVTEVRVSDALVDYVQRLLAASREHPQLKVGLSPRAGLALLRAARAWALLEGRSFCLPEDVQTVFEPIAGHRLLPAPDCVRSRSELALLLRNEVAVA